MTANNTQLEAARAAIETIQAKPDHIWLSDEGEPLRPGQVWTVAGGCGAQPSWFWLLLEPIDESTGNFAPLAIWSDLAGPDDLLAKLDRRTTGLVSFELEATLGDSALGECLGRLPDKLMDYIFSGREAVDDDALRAEFGWGLAYFNTRGPRLIWHEAIAERIEALQAPLRETVYGNGKWLFPPDLLIFLFAQMSQRLKGDSGEQCSPCLLFPWNDGEDHLTEVPEPVMAWAACTHFDELVGGGTEEICCEWLVRGADGTPSHALVYADGQNTPVGHAEAVAQDDGIYIALTENGLAPSAPTIDDPAKLRLVVMLKKT